MKKFRSILLLALATGTAAASTTHLDGWSIFVEGGVHFSRNGDIQSYPYLLSTVPLLADNVSVVNVAGPAGNSALRIMNFQNPSEPFEFYDPEGGLWSMAQQHYTLGLSKTVHLSAGSVLSGWSQFGSWDGAEFSDYAQVTISGTEVWRHDLNQFTGADIGTHSESPWEHWSFTTPTEGPYTIHVRVYGDDQEESYALFQLASPTPIPEPSSVWALALAFSMIAARRRTTTRLQRSRLRHRLIYRPRSLVIYL